LFNDESFQFHNSDSDEGDDDAAMEALNQLSGLQTAAAEAKFNVLTRKLARLNKESRREERMLRKMTRQARINKAREDYLECLEAMSLTDLQSKETELLDDAFLKEKGLQWKEIEFDVL
jgi:predicted nuclease with TOPRIM domain